MQTIDGCGDYDFPNAQVNVENYKEALDVIGGADRDAAVRDLGCQPAYRGYIVVEEEKASSSPDDEEDDEESLSEAKPVDQQIGRTGGLRRRRFV